MKKEDMRKTRTRNALKKAIATLLDKSTIEKITVIDICEEANINRVTFYTHYNDKYELVHDLFEDVLNIIDEKSLEYYERNKTGDPIRDFTSTMSKVVYTTCVNNKKFLQSLTNEENSIFITMLDDIITKKGIKFIAESTDKIIMKYPPEFTVKCLLGAFSGVAFNWALRNDVSEEEFFRNFDKLSYSILKNKIFFDYK